MQGAGARCGVHAKWFHNGGARQRAFLCKHTGC
jgi:hypothetical protein